MSELVTQLSYLVAATLFIFSLRWLNRPKTARQGVFAGVGGMAAAVFGTLLHPEIVNFTWIALAVIAGTLVGVPLAREVTAVRTDRDLASLAARCRPGGPRSTDLARGREITALRTGANRGRGLSDSELHADEARQAAR